MTKNEVLTRLSDKKAFIEKEFEVSKIGLFDSYAKNLQTDNSDIDIYVEFINKTFDNIAGLWNYLEDVYHKKIDLIHFHKRANGSILKFTFESVTLTKKRFKDIKESTYGLVK